MARQETKPEKAAKKAAERRFMEDGLTDRERRFACEYLQCFDPQQAASRAGYVPWDRKPHVYRLARPAVRQFIERILARQPRAEREDGMSRFAAHLLASGYVKRENLPAEPAKDPIPIPPPPKRPEYVYLLRADTGLIKIGRSVDPRGRLGGLRTILPCAVEPLRIIPCSDSTATERELHRRFAASRIRGEWFQLTDEEVAQIEAEFPCHPGPQTG